MKKLITLFAISLIAFAGYSQFIVPVTLTGDCVYSQTGTFYGAHVKVYQGTTLVAEGQATSLTTTNQLSVEIPEFCVNDNTKIYTIVVDALKGFISPYSRICKGTIISLDLYSCEDFLNGDTDQTVILE
ncbi:MAG: hypothetical protein FD170_694 [Bacteroidetes bacterium]|jgi:hypothetical protein|nr:MAG: hypothetical protein FD170_694 [Bacteroidota bacterium]